MRARLTTPFSVYRHFQQLSCVRTHAKMQHPISTYVCTKAALTELYLHRLLCLILVIKEDTASGKGFCGLWDYLAADAASLLHHSGFPSARPVLWCIGNGPAPGRRRHRQAAHSCTQRGKELTGLLGPYVLTVSSSVTAVVHPALLSIKMSLPASFP